MSLFYCGMKSSPKYSRTGNLAPTNSLIIIIVVNSEIIKIV
jgi:hypothetical protein